MNFKSILGAAMLLFGGMYLLSAILPHPPGYMMENDAESLISTAVSWVLGLGLTIPGIILLTRNFQYGSILNPTQKGFPEIMGVQILSVKYHSSDHDYYKRKTWFIIVKNSSKQTANATLNFTLVNSKGITQEKTTLDYKLDPQETVEKKLNPHGNEDRNENETIFLKSFTVACNGSQQTVEINRKIGNAGDDKYKKYLMAAIALIVIYYLYKMFF